MLKTNVYATFIYFYILSFQKKKSEEYVANLKSVIVNLQAEVSFHKSPLFSILCCCVCCTIALLHC